MLYESLKELEAQNHMELFHQSGSRAGSEPVPDLAPGFLLFNSDHEESGKAALRWP